MNALFDSGFNLGKKGFLFFERMGSLEGCNMVNSSCEDFFFLFDSGVEGWTEVLWVNVIWVLWV